MKLNKDGDGYLNLYELEVKCPACGERQMIYEIPVDQLTYDDHECDRCERRLRFDVQISVDVDAQILEGDEP